MKAIRRVLILILILSWDMVISGQGVHTRSNRALKSYTEGKRAYDYVNYEAAEEYLVDATERDSGFIEAFLLLAELYKDQKRYDESSRAYSAALSIDSLFFVPAIFSMGEVEFLIGHYSTAASMFRSFLSKNPKSANLIAKAANYLNNCDFAIEAIKSPVPFTPISLGDSINTADDEYWPAITVDNSYLFFTRQVGEGARNIDGIRYQEDFFSSEISDGRWSVAKNVGSPLNTAYNEGALTLSAGGQYMYFTACNRQDGFGGCDIYYSALASKGWISGVNIGRPVNSKYWESQPSLSADGRKLFFVSNRPGGYGGMDLWYSILSEAGKWSDPINMGGDINTEGDEMSPFIHFDGRTFYFSSNGRPCMGGFDIFMSKMVDDTTWSEAQNLGYPINSQTDEIGMIINSSGETAYFSSAINKEKGRDLFYFEMPEELRPDPVSYVKGNVFDKLTGRKLKATYELSNISTNSVVIRSSTNDQGEFLICLPAGHNYGLSVDREKYLFYSENFLLDGIHSSARPFLKQIALSPVKVGEKMALYNVFFEVESWDLKSESLIELNKLYDLLVSNNNIVIEVGGHTDSSGPDDHNLILSQKRAKAVMDFLIEKGVDSKRISFKGYGETLPVSENDSPEGMRKNRRTEIKIIGHLN